MHNRNLQDSKNHLKNYLLSCNKENEYKGDQKFLNRLRLTHRNLTPAENTEFEEYLDFKCEELFRTESRRNERCATFVKGAGIGGVSSITAVSIFNTIVGGKISLVTAALGGGIVGSIVAQELNGNLTAKLKKEIKNKLADRSPIPPPEPPPIVFDQKEESGGDFGLRARRV